MMRAPVRRVTFPMLAALAAACSDPLGAQKDQLKASRELWERQAIADYRYRYQRICFCGPDVTEPVIIEVRDGEVLLVTRVADGGTVDPVAWLHLTIDELFDEIQAAIEEGAVQVDVTYHPVLGYPTSAAIDFSINIIDEETGFTATELAPL